MLLLFSTHAYLQPLINTFGVEFMTTWQYSKCLPNLKITHANDTSCLVIFSTVSRIPKNIRIYKITISSFLKQIS